jgi:hypothetical protein
VSAVRLEEAREIRMRVFRDGDAIEYLARAALLLRDLEFDADGLCHFCMAPSDSGKHSWQCDMAGALDTLDRYSK